MQEGIVDILHRLTQRLAQDECVAYETLVRLTETLTPQSKGIQWGNFAAKLSAVTRLCDYKFATYDYTQVPDIWRRLYTDAAILKACAALEVCVENSVILECIRDLDLALIVAGDVGDERNEHCHLLIGTLQQQLQALTATAERDLKRLKLNPEAANMDSAMLGQADSAVESFAYASAPTFESVSTGCRCRPFIVRRFAQEEGWPAVSRQGSWSSRQNLLDIAGLGRVVPVEVGANYIKEEWGQDIILWSDFLAQAGWEEPSSTQSKSILYMAQHDLTRQFPALQRGFRLPDFVYTSPASTPDWPKYSPPQTENGVITNLWIGPAGTVSPPHHDPYYNCFVQAVGYKEVWLAPPSCTLRTIDSNLNGEHASISAALMTNTSANDVFGDSLDPRVVALAQRAILEPGDLLFMPPGWWHSLRSLTKSFSVSMWF